MEDRKNKVLVAVFSLLSWSTQQSNAMGHLGSWFEGISVHHGGKDMVRRLSGSRNMGQRLVHFSVVDLDTENVISNTIQPLPSKTCPQ